jgi:transcription elongation factor Elf1
MMGRMNWPSWQSGDSLSVTRASRGSTYCWDVPDESFVLDPRDWISPPFIACPFCGAEEFGVLMITRSGYVRRCRACMKDEQFRLPALAKKILYLDQFAISKLMKVLHPDHRERVARRGEEEERFWLELFERLDRLVKLQVLICASSTSHWEESFPATDYEALRRIYEHLSAGVKFIDPGAIKRGQVSEAFRTWLGGKPRDRTLSVEDVTHGQINAWTDRLQITARLDPDADFADHLRAHRERVHDGLKTQVERWRSGERRAFAEYFQEEIGEYGPLIMRDYAERVLAVGKMMAGLTPFDPEVVGNPSDAQILVTALKRPLEDKGMAHEEALRTIGEFLQSDELGQVPFLRIACGMFAAMAVEASIGQAPRPDQGMIADINVISTVLPYCDAMFIDNRARRYLEKARDQVPLDYATVVFSESSREQLLQWLDDLETSVSPDHRELIEQVYGDTWLQPYTSILADNDK